MLIGLYVEEWDKRQERKTLVYIVFKFSFVAFLNFLSIYHEFSPAITSANLIDGPLILQDDSDHDIRTFSKGLISVNQPSLANQSNIYRLHYGGFT